MARGPYGAAPCSSVNVALWARGVRHLCTAHGVRQHVYGDVSAALCPRGVAPVVEGGLQQCSVGLGNMVYGNTMYGTLWLRQRCVRHRMNGNV